MIGSRSRQIDWRLIAAAAVVVAALVFIIGPRTGRAAAQEQFNASTGRIGSYSPLTEVPEGAQVVYTGLYVTNVYNLDTSSNTYYLSGYLWWRWQGDRDPSLTMEFTNAVENWGLTNTITYEEPYVLEDGSNYQVARVEGRFFQPFDLQDYPLDTQELTVYIEDSADTVDAIVYLPDTASMGLAETMSVPGFNVLGLKAETFVHDYGSDLGMTGVSEASNYAALKYSVEIQRVRNMFIWKMLLPLLAVLFTTFLALVVNPARIDLRTAMPATGLLTIVFLQQAALDAIPAVSMLVLMDKIFVLAYGLVVIAFARIIWDNFKVEASGEDVGVIAGLTRGDRFLLVALAVALVVILAILIAGAL